MLNISNSELSISYIFHNWQVNVGKKRIRRENGFPSILWVWRNIIKKSFSFIRNGNEISFRLEGAPLMRNVWVCRVISTIIGQVSFHLSRFGFLGLAGDRYLAIVHPLKYRDWGKTKNGWIAVLMILAITVIINIPYPKYTSSVKLGRKWAPLFLCPCLEKSLQCPEILMGTAFAGKKLRSTILWPSNFFASRNVWKITVNLNNILVTNLYFSKYFPRFFSKNQWNE